MPSHSTRVCHACGKPFDSIAIRRNGYLRRTCSDQCAFDVLKVPLADRFWQYVVKTEGCWLWTGRDTTQRGYARIRRGGYRNGRILVHRAAWWFANGTEPPTHLHVGHICDTPNCVRNDDRGVYIVNGMEFPRWGHLFLCPQIINEADKVQKGRQARGQSSGRILHPESYPKGSEWPMAKLTDDDVRLIRALYNRGEATQVTLAATYGVLQPTISSIVLGKTWKHII